MHLYFHFSSRELAEPCMNLIVVINFEHSGCSIVGKPLCYHASNPGSNPRGSHTSRSPPRTARPTQSSILPRSVNEYLINTGTNSPGHRR